MAIDLGSEGAIKVATLATTNAVLQLDGKDAQGRWLTVTWATVTAANIVRIEFGAADGSALGTNCERVHPGSSGRAMVYVAGRTKLAVSGSSAFAVSLRLDK